MSASGPPLLQWAQKLDSGLLGSSGNVSLSPLASCDRGDVTISGDAAFSRETRE